MREMRACMRVRVSVCVRACVFVRACVSVCACARVFVCVIADRCKPTKCITKYIHRAAKGFDDQQSASLSSARES